MELVQLYYFRELAQREHLTQTAKFLNLTPPSLSISISKLEQELGVPLFNRVGRNIELNDNGRMFLSFVSEALDLLERGRAKLNPSEQEEPNALHIAISAQTLWLDAFREFVVQYPYISIFRSSVQLNNMRDKSYIGKFDFVFTALNDLPHPDWDYEVLIPNDSPVLVLSPNHPLTGTKEIRLSEVAGESFVALPHDYSSRKMFDDLFAEADVQPNIIAECDYLLREQILRSGRGVLTVSTISGMASELLCDLDYVPIITKLPPRMQAIQWKRGKKISPAGQTFRDFIVRYYNAQLEA